MLQMVIVNCWAGQNICWMNWSGAKKANGGEWIGAIPEKAVEDGQKRGGTLEYLFIISIKS